jgi:energy-converting hydrogenase Eha subunit B
VTAANGGSTAAVCGYDPLGRRIEKSGTGVTTTFFLNETASPDGFAGASGSDALAEYDGSTG